eukprot:m.378775 g.378775  ORF g.378775 m.378775 type:complete len:53 (-) comp95417_c0_seq1:8-166(-)
MMTLFHAFTAMFHSVLNRNKTVVHVSVHCVVSASSPHLIQCQLSFDSPMVPG